MFRFSRYFAAAALIATLIAVPFLLSNLNRSNAASTDQVSVIVELKDEPGAVYKARTEKAGGSVSQDQLKAYRDGLSAKQDQFI